MGSCEGFQVHGEVECVGTETRDRRLVVSLKPTQGAAELLWEELCRFCDHIWDSTMMTQSSMIQSRALKGSFSFTPSDNQLHFTLYETTCTKEDSASENLSSANQTQKNENVMQYEVDGKIYELKSSLPVKKNKTTKKPCDGTANPPAPKTLHFVIENQTYTTASSSNIGEPSSGDEQQTALENSLALLQVTMKDKSIIPERIEAGPDTATFLRNMKDLAKLVAPACSPGQTGCSFRCGQCEEEMTSYFTYIEHAFKHLGTRPYVCTLCQSSFATRAVMRHHLDMHGGKTPFECDYCGKKFRNSSHMKQHRLRHTGEKPYSCQHCDKSFAHKNVLKIHLQTHTGEKPCCCDLCGKLFREPTRLSSHLATHYRSDKSLQCPTCGKCFKMKGMLKLHQLKAKRCKPGSDENGSSATTTVVTESDSTDMIQAGQMITDDRAFIETLPGHEAVGFIDETTDPAGLLDQNHHRHHLLLDGQHEVTIIEAEALEDGTMMVLPVNTYILGGSEAGNDEGVGDGNAVLVQFSLQPGHDVQPEIGDNDTVLDDQGLDDS